MIQAANDEVRGWWVSVPRARRVRASKSMNIYLDLFPGWQVANEIAKPHVSINTNNSSNDSKSCHLKWTFKPKMESNEYSSSKKLFE